MSDEQTTYDELSIETIGGGEAMDQINRLLRLAVENVLDPKTQASKKRIVKLKIEIVPDETREKAVAVYEVDAKFPHFTPGADLVAISSTKRRGYVSTNQMSFDEVFDAETGEVTRIGVTQ